MKDDGSFEEKYDKAIMTSCDNEVRFSGEISTLNPSSRLTPFLERAFDSMRGRKEIILDLSELDFLNSSGIAAIMSAVHRMRPSDKVRIKTDPSRMWQRSAARIIGCLDRENIVVE